MYDRKKIRSAENVTDVSFFVVHVQIFPDIQVLQVFSCLQPILGLIWHVHLCREQVLKDILTNMHLIKAMRCVEFVPVLQVLEN